MDRVLVFDSVTQLDASARGRVVACGSHGGLYAAWLAANAGVRGLLLNDAGIGRHSAGIAGVVWLGTLGIPACTVDYRSARIGDGNDTLASGIVTMANEAAACHGCLPGHTSVQALRCITAAEFDVDEYVPEVMGESRSRIPNAGHRQVWAMDSISLVKPEDSRQIVVTGSHGGLLAGKPDHALDVDVFAAFFNDAGGGKDNAGVARLPVLDARGIAAAAVSCHTARIGDGKSTYETGRALARQRNGGAPGAARRHVLPLGGGPPSRPGLVPQLREALSRRREPHSS
jgi:hypothetical protein